MPRPYLSPSPKPIDGEITVRRIDNGSWRYQIILDFAGYIHMDADDLNTFARTLVEALYDNGDLDMATAERINYLSHVVLQDPREALEAAMMEAGEDF